MTQRKTGTIEVAAAKAGFSRVTGYRLAADPLPVQERKPRGRRRPDPPADIFDTDVVPILEASPLIRPVRVFEELMPHHPDLDTGVMDDPVRQRGYPLGAALAGEDAQALPVRLHVADFCADGLGDTKPGAVSLTRHRAQMRQVAAQDRRDPGMPLSQLLSHRF